MTNSDPSNPFDFDFFISGRAKSAAAQEIVQVLLDNGYRAYLPERDIFYGTKFVPEQFNVLARSRNLIILLTKDFYESHFALADALNFIHFAAQDKRERRLVVIGSEESISGRLIPSQAFTDISRTDHAQERKARIITAVKGGLILSPQSQFAVVSQEENKPQSIGGRGANIERSSILTGGTKKEE